MSAIQSDIKKKDNAYWDKNIEFQSLSLYFWWELETLYNLSI